MHRTRQLPRAQQSTRTGVPHLDARHSFPDVGAVRVLEFIETEDGKKIAAGGKCGDDAQAGDHMPQAGADIPDGHVELSMPGTIGEGMPPFPDDEIAGRRHGEHLAVAEIEQEEPAAHIPELGPAVPVADILLVKHEDRGLWQKASGIRPRFSQTRLGQVDSPHVLGGRHIHVAHQGDGGLPHAHFLAVEGRSDVMHSKRQALHEPVEDGRLQARALLQRPRCAAWPGQAIRPRGHVVVAPLRPPRVLD
mmetsp:Transcript_127932/g.368571  ORF Transcript_127932/g.368571 Transcript_127932/m.368571 type:complete len:249 (-) Transcript_127932:160-906(-)